MADSKPIARTGLDVAIIGGCGHVGLPLGIALAQCGHRVTLVDTSEERTGLVAAGQMPFQEEGGEEALAAVRAAGTLEVTRELRAVADVDAVIITIGTPVDEYHNPQLGPFERAVEEVLAWMRPGQILILRSTVFPGVTERLARRIEERGGHIDLAYCPERIAQGVGLRELHQLPHLIAGTTERATQRAREVFEPLGSKIIEVTPREAELAKLFANAYRYINFAIANQFYMMADRFGADYRRVHAAALDGYPRLSGLPLSGFAGGPCLLKDTMQLASFNHSSFVLGEAAMLVNEGLPCFIVDRLKRSRNLGEETVGILGMAFKGNSDDRRDSLAYKLRKILMLECRRVLCTDPYIQEDDFVSLSQVLAEADVLIIAAPHDEYRDLEVGKEVVDIFYCRRQPGESTDAWTDNGALRPGRSHALTGK